MRGSKNYKLLYGDSQENIYFRMRLLGRTEKWIQKVYNIPQPSLRRCRHKFNRQQAILVV